jgi:prepilin-type processing-associated H-X9-DG protein
MSEKLPKMPEPAGMHTGRGNVMWLDGQPAPCADVFTASQVLSLQRDTWMRAMEVAAQVAERDEFYGSALQHDIAAAIRALPMPEGGE